MKKLLSSLLLVLINNGLSAQVNLTQSLSACYALNGNGNEPVNALTATLSAVTPTVDRFNNPSSALSFNGSTLSCVVLPDDPLLKSTSGMSYGGWIKTYTVIGQYVVFAKTAGTSNFEAYDLVINNTSGYRFRAQKGSGGLTTIADGTTIVSANTWYHVLATVDNTSIKIYVNGVLENTVPSTFSFNYEAGKNVVLGGSNEPGFNLPFNGSMDNMRFYNRVLNASEVNALYTSDPSCLPVPVASFSITPSIVCPNENIQLQQMATNAPNTWAWQMAGATPSTSPLANPVISFANPGTYTVSLIATNSFGPSAPVTQTVTVKPVPNVTTSANNTLICNGNSVVLLASGANTYTWSNAQTFPAINVSPSVTTTYSVIGTATNGCQNYAAITINVSPCTALKQNATYNHFEVYPNPSSGIFMISATNEIKEVTIFDVLGELILKTDLRAHETKQIDISDKDTGIYFVKLKVEGTTLTRKIIKE
ncbi:MAG: LamG-like jellyroll fold domain-containing protein [Bacteroidota bacterium]|nr:LamG-like jellyroll fold domain-containing protein [Bacteroidota bacterium]